jgi:choline dehydrogenase-like flavoprotein
VILNSSEQKAQKMIMKIFLLSLFIISSESANFFEILSKFLSMGQSQMSNEMPSQDKLLQEYDFIVIGAGSAGCALAARLSENPNWKILLLEAGGSENFLMDIPMMVHFLQGYDMNWRYKTEPSKTSCLGMKGNQCNWPRGKVMGGSSVLNYMVYTRGHPRDFDNWSDMGNEGWDYKNVSYYYRRMEKNIVPNITPNYHGANGPLTISETAYKSPAAKAFVEAGREIGYPYVDYNGPSQVGFSFLQATIEKGIRKSTNAAYIYPIRGRKNLHVKKNSRVTKILIDENKRAYGVRFYSNGKYFNVNASKEVLLSAGALNSPQILMLSGIGPAKHLKKMGIDPVVNLGEKF